MHAYIRDAFRIHSLPSRLSHPLNFVSTNPMSVASPPVTISSPKKKLRHLFPRFLKEILLGVQAVCLSGHLFEDCANLVKEALLIYKRTLDPTEISWDHRYARSPYKLFPSKSLPCLFDSPTLEAPKRFRKDKNLCTIIVHVHFLFTRDLHLSLSRHWFLTSYLRGERWRISRLHRS